MATTKKTARIADDDVRRAVLAGRNTLRAIMTFLGTTDDRAVDRALQRMRKSGVILHDRLFGWCVPPESLTSAAKRAREDIIGHISKVLRDDVLVSEHVAVLEEVYAQCAQMIRHAREAQRRHEAANRYVKRGA